MATTLRPGAVIYHDPEAELIYEVDWDDWLNTDAQIATSTWTIDGYDSELTLDSEGIASDGRSVLARLKNGTLGKRYTVSVLITTDESPAQTDERSFYLLIREQ